MTGFSVSMCYAHSLYSAVVAHAETRNMKKIHVTTVLSNGHLLLLSRFLTKAKREKKKVWRTGQKEQKEGGSPGQPHQGP